MRRWKRLKSFVNLWLKLRRRLESQKNCAEITKISRESMLLSSISIRSVCGRT